MKIMKWIMAVLLIAGMAQAANRVWLGGTSTNLATAANWSGGTAFLTTDKMVFSNNVGTGSASLYNDINPASIVVNGLNYTAQSLAYTLSGNQIKLQNAGTAGITTDFATNAQTINCDIELNILNANRAIIVGASAPLTINGIISGALTGASPTNNGITKTGTGTLTLTGNNTYVGVTTISDGVVSIKHNNALGTTASGTTVASGARLELANNVTVAENISISGTGVNQGALRNSSGSNTLTGAIALTGSSTIYSATGSKMILNGGSINAGANTLTLSPGGTGSITVNEVISGSGGLIKTDYGTLTLSGANDFSGQLELRGGTTVANTIANAGTASSLGTGTGSSIIRMGNVGNTNMVLSYIGGATSTDRGVQIGNNSTTPAVTDTCGATIQNNGSGALTFANVVFNQTVAGTLAARTLTIGGANTATNTITGVIADNDKALGGTISLTKADAGNWILKGNNTYSGTTVVSNGTLAINGDQSGATGAVSVDAGATLMGSGIIGGATTVNGNLKPGNSPGTLTFDASLTLGAASTSTFEIVSTSSFDVLKNDGNDTITFNDGSTIVFDTTGYTVNVGDSFQVLSNWTGRAGTLANLVFVGTDLGGGKSLDTSTFLTNGAVTVIPEPATIGMLGLGAVMTILLRRMRIS